MSKHTPGPWKTEDDGDLTIVPDVEANDSYIIAKLFGPDAAANARLLAAAPDLLAALKRVAAEANGGRTSANDDELRDWLYCIEDVARAAIAKAEGVS